MEISSAPLKKSSIDIIDVEIPSDNPDNYHIELASLNQTEDKKGTLPSLSAVPANRRHSKIDFEHLDYKLLQKTLDETHARNKFRKPYGCLEACCQFSTGKHVLTHTTTHSDLDKFGLGMVLYFRFAKYLACFFFIFAVLSVPSLYFAIRASENVGVNGLTDYKGALYLTTLGSIGRGATDCFKTKIDENISFLCEKGNIGNTLQYGRVLEDSNESCEFLSEWDNHCNNDNSQAVTDAFKACQGNSSCQMQVSSNFFDFSKPGCQQWDPAQNPTATFYFRAICDGIEIDLGYGVTVDKEVVGYILTSIDALICILFVVMLITLKVAERKTVVNIEGNVDSVDGFSFAVSNLPNKNSQELKRELWKHFNKITGHGTERECAVVDVQLAESQLKLDLQIKIDIVRKKKMKLLRKFYEKWVYTSQNTKSELSYDELYRLAQNGGRKMMRDFKLISRLEDAQIKLTSRLRTVTTKKTSKVRTAFITFETKEQRDDVYRHYHRSFISRFFFSLCGQCGRKKDDNVFFGSYLKVRKATDPNNILWANLSISKTEKFFRRIVSWIITIGLWAISFTFIVFVKSQQEEISEIVRPTQSCPDSNSLSEQLVREDMAKGGESLGLLECFCRSSLQRQLFDSLCREWTLQKLENNALPFLIVVAIIFTNYGLQYVFRFLSSFERYHSISTESTSRVIKIFVAQFLNTGVILLIVNAQFTQSPAVSFFDGNYYDLIPEWYLNVGTTLLITMIINIVNLPIINTIFYFIKGCLRCCDRGCTFDKTKTRKKTQGSWEKLYTGPEFLVDFRYAQILTVVFICFLYSAGLPLLYLSTFLNLLALYWMDKIFLLRVCRLPKSFDKNLENIVRKTLYAVIFFHLVFAVWTYGNPIIFGNEDAFTEAARIASKYNEIGFRYFINTLYRRALQHQNLVLTILLLVIAGAIITKLFLKDTILRAFQCCFARRSSKINDASKAGTQKKYFNYDLNLEKRFLLKQIYDTTDDELRDLLEQRLVMVNQELSRRNPEEENPLKRFIGAFSYFIGHNPSYKKLFDTKKHEDDELAVKAAVVKGNFGASI